MDDRFRLRFESGERSGEQVPLSPGVLKVGKRPENDLVLEDSSVSGAHAKLEIGPGGARVVDLGSTNGTHVLAGDGQAQRVDQHPLAHGDRLRFGRVELSFLDGELDELSAGASPGSVPAGSAPAGSAPAGSAPAGAAEAEEGLTVGRVRTDRALGGGARPKILVVLLIGAVATLGVVLWKRSGEEGGGRRGVRVTAVVPVAGNLLDRGYSFEDLGLIDEVWNHNEAAPAVFDVGPDWSESGARGYGSQLEPGAWAHASSEEVSLSGASSVQLDAAVLLDGGAVARLGIVLADSRALRPDLSQLSPVITGSGESIYSIDVPQGYDRAHAVLFARLAADAAEGGSAGFDDVVLQAGEELGGVVESESHRFHVQGEPATVGHLFGVAGPALIEVGVVGDGDDAGPTQGVSGLSARASTGGLVLGLREAPAGSRLTFVVPSDLALQGVATTGSKGYAAHSAEFAVEGASSLLLGADLTLVRLGFPHEVSISGRPVHGGRRIEIELGDGSRVLEEVELGLEFSAGRAEAHSLADRAREADRGGRPGEAMQAWTELLDRSPYVSVLVDEAQGYVSQATEAGLAEVRAIAQEVERARFFELRGLFEACGERASVLAESHEGTLVAEAANELLVEVALEVTRLTVGQGRAERERLDAVLRVLDETKSPTLAERVRAAIQERNP